MNVCHIYIYKNKYNNIYNKNIYKNIYIFSANDGVKIDSLGYIIDINKRDDSDNESDDSTQSESESGSGSESKREPSESESDEEDTFVCLRVIKRFNLPKSRWHGCQIYGYTCESEVCIYFIFYI